MAFQKTKFKISIKELAIEFEGDRETGYDVQQGLQQSILGIIGTQGEALALPPPANSITTPPPPKRKYKRLAPKSEIDGVLEANDKTNGDTRSRRSKADSPASLVQSLITEGFFSEYRHIGDVLSALSHKGHNFKQTDLSSPLLSLTKREKLSRKKDDKGKWVYKKGPKA